MKDETSQWSENKQEVFPGDMFELNYILYFTSYVNLTEKPAAPVFSGLLQRLEVFWEAVWSV